jgi:hypothetical protein
MHAHTSSYQKETIVPIQCNVTENNSVHAPLRPPPTATPWQQYYWDRSSCARIGKSVWRVEHGDRLFWGRVFVSLPIAASGEYLDGVALTNLSNFGTRHNCVTNQNSALNNEGYDSEGNPPHVADEPNDDIEDYFEKPAEGGGLWRQWRRRWHQQRTMM